MLWQGAAEIYETTQKLLPEYFAMYKPWEERVKLVEELDRHHDGMKNILQLHHGPKDSRYLPVQAILNGLPEGWQAEVVSGVSEELGVIKVSQSMGRDLAPGVRALFAMFHLEDVFDEQGLPAIQSPDLNMPSLLKRQVQIVARSLCPADERNALLDLARKAEGAGAPLLQAIVVCLRPNTKGPLPYRTFPRPTVLALTPEDIGGGPSAFFLCPTLQHKMDFKVRLYVTKLNLESLASFRNTVKPIDNEDVALDKLETLKERMKAVDVNDTRKLVYGEFPKDAAPLTQMFGRLPMGHIEQLVHMAGRPIFLYCRGLAAQAGVVELMVPHPSMGTVKTYGIFQLAHYRFFFPPDCFGRDLANIMPLPAKETFAVCAKLAWPESKIPYVVTHIWNENLRRELGRPPPTGPINEKEVLTTCAETAGEILGLRKVSNKVAPANTNTTSTSDAVPVSAKVMVFNSQVRTFDKNRIHIENGQMVANFNNIVGDVESVLSDHHAIVKFRPLKSSKEYRVLCHSDDVFSLDFPEAKNQNPHKFSAAWDLWKESAKTKKLSLTGLMRSGAKVRLNAALLLSNGPNPAEVPSLFLLPTNITNYHFLRFTTAPPEFLSARTPCLTRCPSSASTFPMQSSPTRSNSTSRSWSRLWTKRVTLCPNCLRVPSSPPLMTSQRLLRPGKRGRRALEWLSGRNTNKEPLLHHKRRHHHQPRLLSRRRRSLKLRSQSLKPRQVCQTP